MNIFKDLANIFVNDTMYQGTSIVVTNGKVKINGVDVTPDSKTINIKVDGNIETLQVDYCEKVTVNGNIGSVKTASGDIECQDVAENVTTVSGDITCGNVGGNVTSTSGDVDAKEIKGSVKTISGDISKR